MPCGIFGIELFYKVTDTLYWIDGISVESFSDIDSIVLALIKSTNCAKYRSSSEQLRRISETDSSF